MLSYFAVKWSVLLSTVVGFDNWDSPTKERLMAIKNWKRGFYRVEDQALEFTNWRTHGRFKFPWHKRGSWKSLPPRRHPGWAAYHDNKDNREG